MKKKTKKAIKRIWKKYFGLTYPQILLLGALLFFSMFFTTIINYLFKSNLHFAIIYIMIIVLAYSYDFLLKKGWIKPIKPVKMKDNVEYW